MEFSFRKWENIRKSVQITAKPNKNWEYLHKSWVYQLKNWLNLEKIAFNAEKITQRLKKNMKHKGEIWAAVHKSAVLWWLAKRLFVPRLFWHPMIWQSSKLCQYFLWAIISDVALSWWWCMLDSFRHHLAFAFSEQ